MLFICKDFNCYGFLYLSRFIYCHYIIFLTHYFLNLLGHIIFFQDHTTLCLINDERHIDHITSEYSCVKIVHLLLNSQNSQPKRERRNKIYPSILMLTFSMVKHVVMIIERIYWLPIENGERGVRT